MSSDPPPITGVTGGSHGLAVSYDKAIALAASYDASGNQMRAWAAAGGRVLKNGDLLESSILSPLSFAEAEVAVLNATTGPDGILVESVAWETDAVLIRVTVAAFEASDDLVRTTFEVLDYTLGHVIGYTLGATLPITVPAVVLAGLVGYGLYAALPPEQQAILRAGLGQAAKGGAADLQEWLADHPELTQHLLNGGGGLVDGFWSGATHLPVGLDGRPFHPTTESAAALLAGLYPADGHAEVTGPIHRYGDNGAVTLVNPQSLVDVMRNLDEVAGMSATPDSANNGTISIQRLLGPDGQPSYIVYVPGTDTFNLPGQGDGDIRDMKTNFLGLGGASTAHAEGVLIAMRTAGIEPGDPVMLAAHSQGGIVAGYLAHHPGDFNITNVVTAGAPTAHLGPFPEHTSVLSLENRSDVVPLTDGEDNPDRPNHVTVRFDGDDYHRPGEDVGDVHSELSPIETNHYLEKYEGGALAVERSANPTLVDVRDDLREHFLNGGSLSGNQIYQITRTP